MYSGFNGSVASMRARRGHRGAGACTKPKVKGCSRGRCSRALRQAPLPGRIPARSPGTRARPVRGVPSSWPYGRLELSTRRGVIGARVSPRCASERTSERLGRGQRLQLQPAPVLPPPGDRLFTLFFFFRCTPEALAAAGRHPLAAARSQRLGGGWRARSTAAVKGSSSPSTTTGLTWRRERPLRAGHGSFKKRCKGKKQRGRIGSCAPSLRCPSRSKAPWPGPAVPVREGEGSRRQGRKRRREKQGNAGCSWRGSGFSHLWLSSHCCTQKLPLNLSGEQNILTIKYGVQNYPQKTLA